MDEILQKLLQSELLSEETKAEISEQWQASLSEFKEQIREQVSGEVRAELAGQWITEREELVEKVDSLVAQTLVKEMEELKGDIERFRDLEAEYAKKLVEEKHALAEKLDAELETLIDKIDAFFEMRISAEMDELKEDIEIVKQNDFGRQIFETFAATFSKHYVDEKSVQSKLNVTESKLKDAEQAIQRLEDEKNRMVREAKMEKVLAPLSGKAREQMAMVLKTVETDRLEESYKFFIGRIMSEGRGAEQAPGAVALSESKQEARTTLVTGQQEEEPAGKKPVNESLAEMKRLAGI